MINGECFILFGILTGLKAILNCTIPENYFDNLANDPFEGNKSRKSSGFSETTTKSRHFSGYERNKSRNCSGNSGSPGCSTNG